MFVGVKHQISDPQTFFGIAKQALGSLPQGVTLHLGLPNDSGSSCICVWEAPSVDVVRNLIEQNMGHVSTNEYFEIKNAMGVSTMALGIPGSVAV